MMLAFTAIDKNAQFRDFCCLLTELEAALDFLNTITLQGDKIIKACILDEGHRTELSPEAFDGQSFTQNFLQLKEQWQAALNGPVRSGLPANDWLIKLTRQRIKLYDDRIDQLAISIHHLELLCLRAEETIYREPNRTKLIGRYGLMLDMYQRQINQVQDNKQLAQRKLK